jgi:hypothetical protein
MSMMRQMMNKCKAKGTSNYDKPHVSTPYYHVIELGQVTHVELDGVGIGTGTMQFMDTGTSCLYCGKRLS